MTQRLLIVLVNTDPRNVEELGAPFYYAAIAAAMDYEVDVLCTATAGKLLLKGVAEKLCVKPGDPKTIYDWIKEAHDQLGHRARKIQELEAALEALHSGKSRMEKEHASKLSSLESRSNEAAARLYEAIGFRARDEAGEYTHVMDLARRSRCAR